MAAHLMLELICSSFNLTSLSQYHESDGHFLVQHRATPNKSYSGPHKVQLDDNILFMIDDGKHNNSENITKKKETLAGKVWKIAN